jgi:hypothetical protein
MSPQNCPPIPALICRISRFAPTALSGLIRQNLSRCTSPALTAGISCFLFHRQRLKKVFMQPVILRRRPTNPRLTFKVFKAPPSENLTNDLRIDRLDAIPNFLVQGSASPTFRTFLKRRG